ncbi:MAG TPA: MFS transporter [Jatrophihabitans sp.]|nr:MFS transporter [Jatrophihabitans sp.]
MGGVRANGADTGQSSPGLRDVFRNRTFAVLYSAETQSIAGDQLARVALSVLVFQQTGSAAATAATYAATYLPAVLGGWVLGRLGDRYPRRAVMVGCDLARAALFAAMTIPGLPLAAVIAFLIGAVFLGPAFSASQVSYLSTVLDKASFRVATGLRMVTGQAAQVAGFAVGGVLVAVLHPHGALLVDAATYLISAVAVGALRSAPPSRAGACRAPDGAEAASVAAPRRSLRRDGQLWAMAGLSVLAGFFVVPEGLAVPFGARTGATTVQIGLLLAALPLGGALGAALLVHVVPPARRLAAARWMAIGCGLPLLVPAFVHHWSAAMVCWLVSGVLGAYQVEIVTSLVHRIPDASRSRILGILSASLLGAQGLGVLAFGLVARLVPVATTIAIAGLAGSCLALVLGLWLRSLTAGPATPSSGGRHYPRRDDVVGPLYRPRHSALAFEEPVEAAGR